MNILITDAQVSEPTMLAACIERCKRWGGEGSTLDVQHEIICNKRTRGGWLEYMLILKYESGQKLVVGAIQRTPTGEIEFHS